MPDKDIAAVQKEIADRPVGDRIAIWAEKFIGTPYDPDPQGEYVTRDVIVADNRVDCMYLSFRTVELALSLTPEQAVSVALDKRFITMGKLDSSGKVTNYGDRFQYGEDMLDSGKWGREITSGFGEITAIRGSRGKEKVGIIPKETFLKSIKASKGLASGESPRRQKAKGFDTLKNGDFIFFIKAPEKRQVGEIVGHIGIVKLEADGPYLIHAGGVKNKRGEVRKVKLYDYIKSMPFIGVRIGRFY